MERVYKKKDGRALREGTRVCPVLKRIGNAWLASKSALLLYIPSVIDPLAKNVLINPLHLDAASLKIGEVQPFTFDKRLIKR